MTRTKSREIVMTGISVKFKKETPKMYDVILHNNDKSTMEMVVQILNTAFSLPLEESVRLMLTIHKTGKGTAGTYPIDEAYERISKADEIRQIWNDRYLEITVEEHR